jgi:hypothetical protein
VSRHLLVGLVAVVALLVVACEREPEPEAAPSPIPVSEECREAFADAVAAVEEYDEDDEADPDDTLPGGGVGAGTLNELRPTLTACTSTTEWFEAYRAHWTERTEGIAPSAALRTLCDRAGDEAREAEVCRQIVIDGPEEQPGES